MIPNFKTNDWTKEKIIDEVLDNCPLNDQQIEFLNYYDKISANVIIWQQKYQEMVIECQRLKQKLKDRKETNEYEKIKKNNIKIINHYDLKYQINLWIESMVKLVKELCVWARNYDEWEGDISTELFYNMIEEITNVTICLDQLKYSIVYSDDKLILNYKKKVEKQLKIIEERKDG